MLNPEKALQTLPDKPGVYLFKDGKGRIIYVGKALSLKKRVRSYFTAVQKSPKTEVMTSKISGIDYIITDSEVEALILESNLIKKHRPRYNVLMKDDKNYPYIKITMKEQYPRLVVARRMKKDGSKYFGPYTNASAMRETLKLIRKIFPVRSCKKDLDEVPIDDRACLNYHIKRCLAPCQNKVSRAQYRKMIDDIILFLKGRGDRLLKRLEKAMRTAAAEKKFERAAELRDQIFAIKKVVEKQKIISSSMEDQDIIAAERNNNETYVEIFFIRNGKLIERENVELTGSRELSKGEIMNSFLKQFYSDAAFIPKEIIVRDEVEDKGIIEEWLTDKKGSRVYIKVPKRGEKKKLVDMVYQNAVINMKFKLQKGVKNKDESKKALEELKLNLDLDEIPYRIEGFDISNIQGSESVASMVVFEDGRPKKSDYRKFKIKTVNGPDDFKSMKEVIYRRFSRWMQENRKDKEINEVKNNSRFGVLPDLIMIDGGKGQLNAALKALKELGLDNVKAVGLAKEFEHIFVEGQKQPIVLDHSSKALQLLQRVRDEAHRFAVSYHRKLRKKRTLTSVLDEIPGIGKKRRNSLLKEFGSVDAIKKASVERLARVKGMNRTAAKTVYRFLNKNRE